MPEAIRLVRETQQRCGREAKRMDLSWFTLLTAVVATYYLVLLAISTLGRKQRVGVGFRWRGRPDDWKPAVVVVVPARDEEAVIGRTLDALASSTYSNVVVLVMNDGSSDRTSELVRQQPLDRDIYVVDRAPHEAGQGKGAVLNHALRLVREATRSDHPVLGGRNADEVILCVMDADGLLDPDAIASVVPAFRNPKVGAVQIGVRIDNADSSLLTRMQDIEFVGFSGLVQNARNVFGSASLGGNGQFTRLSALESLGREPWTHCLSEDLDLSLSLIQQGYEVRFCGDVYVSQQGLSSLPRLVRQRSRWVQGHYQCWRHIRPILLSADVPWKTRLDLVTYLTLISFLVLMTFGVTVNLLAAFGVVTLTNDIWMVVPDGPIRNSLLLALSCGPAISFLFIYQRRARNPLRAFEVPAFAAAFCLYGYHWLAAQIWAFGRMASGRSNWAKTPRELVAVEASHV